MTRRAVVMAGGQGSRMRNSRGSATPKPLVPLLGVPLLERAVLHLLRHGFREIRVVTSASDRESNAFCDQRIAPMCCALGVRFSTYREDEPLGTFGAVPMTYTDLVPVLVVNADNVSDLDLNEFWLEHRESGALVSVAVHHHGVRLPYGCPRILNGRIEAYEEKPVRQFLVASAFYALSAEAMARFPRGQRVDAPDFLNRLAKEGRWVRPQLHRAAWYDINDASVLDSAAEWLAGSGALEMLSEPPQLEVVGAVLDVGDAIVVERRPASALLYPDVWDTPGGKVEGAESPEDAICRELEEELGLTALELRRLVVFDDFDECSQQFIRHHVFHGRVDPCAIKPKLRQELRFLPFAATEADLSRPAQRSLAWFAKTSRR